MTSALRIIFAGAGEFGLPTLKAIAESPHGVVHVYSQPDRPSGRGKKLMPTPISQFALQNHLPLTRTENINACALQKADLLVVIAFGQKIAPRVTNHGRLGSVNLHASILPRHRGAAPINWAMLSGDKVAGNSVIRLAEKMDAGAVLGTSQLHIGQTETAGELHDRLSEDGVALMMRVIDELSSGTARETPQDHTLATLAPKLSRESTLIDFTQPAEMIARQIRALHPWPGCRVRLTDAEGKEAGRATLVRARDGDFYYPRQTLRERGIPVPTVMPGEIANPYNYPPGSLPRIGAGDGRSVEILEIQPEGKRPMPLSAYRNGHRWEAGMRVESIL